MVLSEQNKRSPASWSAGDVACCCRGNASAQSTDVAWPSPVRTNEVHGTIVARDIGDPRVTDHFYAFTGTPGMC